MQWKRNLAGSVTSLIWYLQLLTCEKSDQCCRVPLFSTYGHTASDTSAWNNCKSHVRLNWNQICKLNVSYNICAWQKPVIIAFALMGVKIWPRECFYNDVLQCRYDNRYATQLYNWNFDTFNFASKGKLSLKFLNNSSWQFNVQIKLTTYNKSWKLNTSLTASSTSKIGRENTNVRDGPNHIPVPTIMLTMGLVNLVGKHVVVVVL